MHQLATFAESASRRATALTAVFFTLLLLAGELSAAVIITDVKGVARLRRPNTVSWNEVPVNYVVNNGDEVKTDRSSRVTMSFDDGSKIELAPNSSYLLETSRKAESMMTLSFGKLKAWVTKASSRRFAVRTPTAVCSVRGTEFDVNVNGDGSTNVNLLSGLLGVQDNKGNEILLKPGESVDVDLRGISKPEGGEKKQTNSGDAERREIKREVGLEMNKEQILAAAAEEVKQALYQLGKVMTDVNGNRVRIEEYILRPAANQFKFVVLNERPDRFDYFFRTGTFNTALPDDISTALRQLPGCIGTACTFWLTGYQTAWSNTQDAVVENVSGGHLVDVNNNGVAGDDVTRAFDPGQNDFFTLPAGTPFFTTLFDTYDLKFNNVTHTSWVSGVGAYNPGGCGGGVGAACGGIQSMGDINGVGDQRTVTNVVNVLKAPNCTNLDNCTGNRDPGKFHDIVYRQNALGTIWDKFDNYIIDDNGEVSSHTDFAGVTNGADYKKRLLDFNYQQIITASEFGGRKIDLVFEPKILMQSGLIP
ncbi:MAG: FecR domain-containing protein [Elusimicrobia bacterium]|nr:FecR domain-containing protein [Elusimicrobiota bacterium]